MTTPCLQKPLQAAILVGGRGTRLGALTAVTPKPMIAVAGRPMIEHVIARLAEQGVTHVLLLAGYLGDQLAALERRGEEFGVEILCRTETAPAGTAGALLEARELLAEGFLLLNGDTFFDVDIADLVDSGAGSPSLLGVMALNHVDDLRRYGAVIMDGPIVESFAEKGAGAGPGLMNGGVYWLRRALLDRYVVTSPSSLESDVFPGMVAERRLTGRRYDGYFIDIGVPADLERARLELPAVLARPTPRRSS